MANPAASVNISSALRKLLLQAHPSMPRPRRRSRLSLEPGGELGAKGITVTPFRRNTQTDMLRRIFRLPSRSAMVANTGTGSLGTPEDIADVVAFLCSEDARWVTGQVIGGKRRAAVGEIRLIIMVSIPARRPPVSVSCEKQSSR